MNKSSKDFFQSIGEFSHNIGIYLTYTLDNEVIDKLTEFATGTKLILHEIKQGKTIDDNGNSTIVCLPIKTLKPNEKNCFHSKLALLKSENGAKLIVGSANLSRESFATEKEIAIEMELDFENRKDVFIYNKILNFFDQLNNQLIAGNDIWEQTLDKLRFEELPEKESDIQFVFNNADKSILDEIKRYLAENRKGQKVKGIKIATPFVSNNYLKIEEINAISNNISVYLRNGAKIEPFKAHHFSIFQPSYTHKKRKGFHAKLILVEFNSDAVLFIGSANFTEQGFFKTLNEGACQECGIILKVSSDQMNEWFSDNLWKQLSEIDIEKYEEAHDNSLEFFETQNCPYAWAEKENSKIITYIFNPNPDTSHVTKIKGGKKMNLSNVDGEFLFKTTDLEAQNQKVNFYIGDEKFTIPVFELSEYISGLSEKGESIFDAFKGIYSVNPLELDAAIKENKLSVKETINIQITEPPKLEQYFYNVKYLIQSLKHKKRFSVGMEKEVIAEINKSNDGRTLYLTLQLFKLFRTKDYTENLKSICSKRISELSDKLNIDKKKLNTFIKGWLTLKI
jgi:phosphatidylserine/phosphatidylglycerophosphate/cardiolipin synthase-like enzyme